MEFLYLFIGLVIGAIGGGYFGKKLSADEQDFQRLEQKATESQNTLEQYQKEVAAHLESSATLLAQMNDTCTNAMQQLDKSTQLLNKAKFEANEQPFFSAETEAQIRANPQKTKASKSVKDTALTEPPRDYSGDPSGLFSDEKQVVTNS